MEIVGDRKFVEVPGSRTHELPPLLVKMSGKKGTRRMAAPLAWDIDGGEAVVGAADQFLLERHAVQDLVHQLQPSGLAGGREFGAEGQGVG